MELDKIYNIDCLEGMKQIPDGSVDAIICDLPYGITSCEWDVIIPFDKLWEQYNRIAKATAPIALFCHEPFTSIVVQSNLKCYRHKWIWNKKQSGSFVNAKYMPLQIEEDIIVFSLKTPCNYYPIMRKGIFRKKGGSKKVLETMKSVDTGHYTFNDDYYPTNILEYNKERGLHPTQKPVDLLRYLVRTYSNEGDTILDNCMGSGTTAVACIKEKRHFIGFELNKDYYDKACQRIDAEKRQLTLF